MSEHYNATSLMDDGELVTASIRVIKFHASVSCVIKAALLVTGMFFCSPNHLQILED